MINSLRKRFWTASHDCLEYLWHWVYRNKMPKSVTSSEPINYGYHTTYLFGNDAVVSIKNISILEEANMQANSFSETITHAYPSTMSHYRQNNDGSYTLLKDGI